MANSVEKCHPNSPERSCIVCRETTEKQELIRLSLLEDHLCFDLRHKLLGRGYYLCARRACLEKGFAGAIKRVTKHDATELASDVVDFALNTLIPGFRKRTLECITSGRQSGQLLIGADAVEEAARNNVLACYLLASDISDASFRKYGANAGRKDIPCIIASYSGSFYGHLFNKSDKMVLGWKPGPLYEIWMNSTRALEHLMEDFDSEISKYDSSVLLDELQILDKLRQIQMPSE